MSKDLLFPQFIYPAALEPEQVFDNPCPRESLMVVLFNGQGDIGFARRAKSPAGLLTLVTGHLEENEKTNVKKALRREVREEIGVDHINHLKNLGHFSLAYPCRRGGKIHNVNLFQGETQGSTVSPDAKETTAVFWLPQVTIREIVERTERYIQEERPLSDWQKETTFVPQTVFALRMAGF